MLVKAPPLKLYVYGVPVPAVTFMVTVPDTFAFVGLQLNGTTTAVAAKASAGCVIVTGTEF
jgi:hypothetical protein